MFSVDDWLKNFENKVKPFVEMKDKLDEAAAKKMGIKDPEAYPLSYCHCSQYTCEGGNSLKTVPLHFSVASHTKAKNLLLQPQILFLLSICPMVHFLSLYGSLFRRGSVL